MDFKDILTQLDSLKGNEKKPVVEKKTKRPSNMLTESTKSTEVVQPVSKELKLPSLSNIFEELSLEPAKPGAQTIQKDGEPIGSVSNPQVANQMQQAMDKGELTIGQEMTEDEQLHEVAFLAALGPALMTGARVAAPWLAKRGAQMIGGVGKFAGKNPGTTAGVAGGAYVADKAGDAFDAVNDTIDSGKEFASGQVERIVAMGDRAGGMIRNAVGDGAFDAVKATASKYGLPMLAAVALLYGGKKVIDKVLDDDEETLKEAKDWIAGATKNKGAFTKKAKSHGMPTKAFAKKVLANKDDFPAKTEKQANLAKTLGKFDETDTPPEAGIDLTSPISGGNMREGAQYPADDGSPNSTNDEKGNAAANAALAANDSDTPQLVKEKAKGKVSKSSKLPSISKVKSMCSEGLSTSQIKQLHPKCNQQELNIMIKNTKTNLKEGAEHILKAAKHMGKSHGLCKGSYACPHDAGSEGARAYHEGYKTGLDEACGMKNTYEDANDGFSADAEGMGIRNMPIAGMEEGIIGGVGGAMAGSKLGGMAGSAVGGSIGGVPGATIGKGVGAALGGIAGDKMTGDGVFEEGEDEIVDTMASYGAMDEAEFDEGNAFSGALAKTAKGDDFSVGGKTYTKTTEQEQDAGLDDKYDWNASTEGDREATYEDEWTFESLEKELDFHLIEGKDGMPSKSHIMKMCKDGKSKAEICKMHPDCDQGKLKNMIDHCKKEMKSKLDEGYTMSITSGEENQPDRVSVNATDAEADKLIKFVKDVGLGQYGDAEVLDSPGEVADVSFYGSPDASEEPMSSHDDMLKLMGIVDMGNGDFEDEVESPGSCGSDDISVQVDDMDEACGDKAYEDQGYDDKEDESLGMRTGKESGKHQSMKDRRDDSYGKFGKRDEEHREISKEGQGYDDKEDESLGMRTGKESDKKQSM